MIVSAEAEIRLPCGVKLNQSFGSVMHGLLIEQMDPEWAEAMHQEAVRPYSQYLTVEDGRVLWRIGTLTEEAFDHIIVPAMKCRELYSRQKGFSIGISSFSVKENISYEELARKYWTEPRRIHHVDIAFLTSTSFKTNGGYAVFPDPLLLFRNLIRKWNRYSDASSLEEKDLANQMAEAMQITDYHLHMHPYSLEGTRINAFRGTLRLGFFKTDMASRLTAMLAAYARFAGYGVKTALGMGGTVSHPVYWNKEE